MHFAASDEHSSRGKIYADVAELYCFTSFVLIQHSRATQAGTNASGYFARGKWFAHVIVGASVERFDFVLFLTPRRNNKDRSMAPLAYFPNHIDSISVGQTEVQ